MLRTKIFSEFPQNGLEELYEYLTKSVKTAIENKGVYVSPIIREDPTGSYFTIAIGEEGQNDLELAINIDHTEVTESP